MAGGQRPSPRAVILPVAQGQSYCVPGRVCCEFELIVNCFSHIHEKQQDNLVDLATTGCLDYSEGRADSCVANNLVMR